MEHHQVRLEQACSRPVSRSCSNKINVALRAHGYSCGHGGEFASPMGQLAS